MYLSPEFIHYSVIALAVALNSAGVGIGQGLTSWSALAAINRQPAARNDILKIAILGIAVIETAAILGTFVAFTLLMGAQTTPHYYQYLSEIGILFAISITGFTVGIASAFPAQTACHAVARQPFFTQRILSFMLMTQALIQTPIISGLLVSLFIQSQSTQTYILSDSLRLIASGLCVGLGNIGPVIGLGLFSKVAVECLGINRNATNKILSFTFISEAIIETPIIFCLVIAITLLFIVPRPLDESMIDGIVFLAAGLCSGLGTFGPGISSAKTAAAACKQIALNPQSHSMLSRTSMLAQGLIETIIIYAVLLSFMLIFLR